jgi:hypothetical protein
MPSISNFLAIHIDTEEVGQDAFSMEGINTVGFVEKVSRDFGMTLIFD